MNKAEQLRQKAENYLLAKQQWQAAHQAKLREADPTEVELIYTNILKDAEAAANQGRGNTNYAYSNPSDENFPKRIDVTGQILVKRLQADGFTAQYYQIDLSPTPWELGYDPNASHNDSLVINLCWQILT